MYEDRALEWIVRNGDPDFVVFRKKINAADVVFLQRFVHGEQQSPEHVVISTSELRSWRDIAHEVKSICDFWTQKGYHEWHVPEFSNLTVYVHDERDLSRVDTLAQQYLWFWG